MKTLTDNGDKIHMVLSLGSFSPLYYFKASYSSGDSTGVLLNQNIPLIYETFFVGSTTETVGTESEVYPSYTVGTEYAMTSNLGNTIGNNSPDGRFAFILPSHKSTSCLTDPSDSLTIEVDTKENSILTEMSVSSPNGDFSTPSGISIEYGSKPIQHWNIHAD